MRSKRLEMNEPADSGRKLLPDVHAPVRGQARSHGLIQALEIALAFVEAPLDYDTLMGLSTLAFRTPPWPENPEPTLAECIQAVDALNNALTGGVTVTSDALPEQWLDLVVAEIDAGRPCVAIGWGSVPEDWSVIAGYDRTRNAAAGHCRLEDARDAYEIWPAEFEALVTVAADARIAGDEALQAAIQSAHVIWEESGAARYQAWIGELLTAVEEPELSHERAVQLLDDSRSAAAVFVARVAAGDDTVRGEWLAAAAAYLNELVELIEGRGGPPYSHEAIAALADEDGRGRWAARLGRAFELEQRIAGALRRAPLAEYPPGDDEF
jgi:hypothetical protein